ncbi:MAG: hypothetical protein LAT82_01705 [Nanoarchaeota archaeon]|nr:hypothetical protein [Nanoarchaeota archaeon]
MKFKFILFYFILSLYLVVNFSLAIYVDLVPESDSGILATVFYCDPNVENCPAVLSHVDSSLIDIPIENIKNFNFDPSATSEVWKGFYVYKSGKRLEVYSRGSYGTVPMGPGSSPENPITMDIFAMGGYYSTSTGAFKNDLRGVDSCRVIPVIDGDVINLNSNLDYLSRFSTGTIQELPSSLEQYYFMNANVQVYAQNGDGTVFEIYNNNILMPQYDIARSLNYNLNTQTGVITVNGNSVTLPPGEYDLKVKTDTTIEPKCDSGRGTIQEPVLDSFTISAPPSPQDVVINEFISVDRNQIILDISRNGFTGAIPLQFDFTRIPVHQEEWNMNDKRINNSFSVTIPQGSADGQIRINVGSISYGDIEQSGGISTNQFSSTFAGRFDVKVNVQGNSTTFSNQGLFFCQSGDSSCDSVPDVEDVCPEEFGTPFYKGCPSEDIAIELIPPIEGHWSLSCSHRSYLLYSSRYVSYDSVQNRLRCSGGGGLFGVDNHFYINDTYHSSGNKNVYVNNPTTAEYKCYASGRLFATCSFEFRPEQNEIEVSVFDMDRDGLNYYPTWWINRFESYVTLNNIQSEDLCPASYGLAQNDGCPVTNKELIYINLSESGRDLITFPDFNEDKIFFEDSTNSIFIGRDRAELSGIQSISTNPIQIDITSSCIPTIPLSQILLNNPQLSQLINLELNMITLTKQDIENQLTQYEEQIQQLDPQQLVDELQQDTLPPGLVDSLPPGLQNMEKLPKGLRRDRVPTREDMQKLIEQKRLEEMGKISRISVEEKRRIIDYLRKVSDCSQTIQREDELDLFSLTSTLHLLTPIDTTQRTRDVINSIINTANQLQISKTIDPQISSNQIRTQISLNIDNIPANTTIWQVIPKESIQDFDALRNSIQQGNADEIRVKDKDPIIGWYFGSGGSSGDIGFEIEGTGEGGSTIPIEDTIYFNYGELIVNYREFGCFESENELFTIQNITGSLVNKTTFSYSVCITHNGSHDVSPSAPLIEQYFGIDSTQRLTQNIRDIDLFKQEGSDLGYNTYYAMFYGISPPRLDYSCIGSIDEVTGLFGGCMYRPNNRLWMYYGDDPFPPQIDLFYVPSHSIQPQITIFDEISGVSEIRYCITEDEFESCNFPAQYIQVSSFTQGENLVEISIPTIRCPDVRDCEKHIRIYVEDVEGNSVWHNETLLLLQEATSCNAQCIAQPLPGRYLASCHRISGCEFMGLDSESEEEKGTTVANLCNYKVPNSWVDIGGGLEVQCPSGPIRVSRFTQIPFTVNSNICGDINSNRIPVIIDGEEVTMHIITC